MLLLFRSGWFHLIFGVLLLGGAIFLVDFQRGDLGETYSFLGKTAWLNPELLFWLPLAILGHLVIYAAITLLCILIAPKTFPRWWFSSLQGVYRNLNLLRALSIACLVGLLLEPFLRFGVYPLLLKEVEQATAILVLAGFVALASWTPYTNLLIFAAFAETYWFGRLYLESGNPFVPVIGHGISEFFLVLILWKLHSLGMTDQPPPKPESLTAVTSGE
ncbi:MAG: hypothetical protein KC931_19005 [Candidatus Omnitrophica bacterium]|nr:hypothetical protein [Candidatus Omnitrophota bacterium]MCA9416716.1 hypothetical protein [Candidatus Omnitrophota bacterium]MCA9435142.1 hypothetical protein [Candidatus Omnitrophota bacterium]MCA9441676.1 hypothetical protein [Candidatus Omnitrophota bacterium]MCA9449216.1 hypothetical protein [Candidatus Omnitrophota bacterium]